MSSDKNAIPNRRIHIKTNLTAGENMFILDEEHYRYGIPGEKVSHFLSDAALFVLARLSVFHNKVGRGGFYAGVEDDVVPGSLLYSPTVNTRNELDGASVTVWLTCVDGR
jgi:hypothetical protein